MATAVGNLFICPYNKSHVVNAHKLPNHLVKCRKNNPTLAGNILICPYNQCHHIPKDELANHFSTCQEYHKFHSLSIKPATCESLPHRPLQNLDMLEQEHNRYHSYRNNFCDPPKTDDPRLDAIQHQKNLDDLDEWFVE